MLINFRIVDFLATGVFFSWAPPEILSSLSRKTVPYPTMYIRNSIGVLGEAESRPTKSTWDSCSVTAGTCPAVLLVWGKQRLTCRLSRLLKCFQLFLRVFEGVPYVAGIDILSQQFANRHGEQHVALIHTGYPFVIMAAIVA